jgi:hypothetical protein
MSVYKDVKAINEQLNNLTRELGQLRTDLDKASSYASGQYTSDVAGGLFSQISFAAQAGFAEVSRLESLVFEKEEDIEEKEEELKSNIHFYCSDILLVSEHDKVTLRDFLDKNSLVSQWDEVQEICFKRFGESVFWELCRK